MLPQPIRWRRRQRPPGGAQSRQVAVQAGVDRASPPTLRRWPSSPSAQPQRRGHSPPSALRLPLWLRPPSTPHYRLRQDHPRGHQIARARARQRANTRSAGREVVRNGSEPTRALQSSRSAARLTGQLLLLRLEPRRALSFSARRSSLAKAQPPRRRRRPPPERAQPLPPRPPPSPQR